MVTLRSLRDSISVPRTSRGDFKLAETLLKAIREHAIVGHPEDREKFQQQIGELNRRMVNTDDDAELLMIAGAAQQALRLHELETNNYWRGKTTELQAIVTTMTLALTDFAARQSESVARLLNLEQSLESVSRLEDLRMVRKKIEECVNALRVERELQWQAQNLANEKLGIKKSEAPADPVTGLASRSAAEEAIEQRLARCAAGYPEDTTLALFVVHRIQQVNSRFGHAVGDEMLKTFLQHIANNLQPTDLIFRWSGTAFLAIMDREDAADAVREMKRIASFKIDQQLEIGDRSVMVPVSASVSQIALTRQAHLPAMSAQFDQFVNAQLQR